MPTSTLFSGVSIAPGLLDVPASATPVVDDVTHRLESELRRISALTEELRKSVSTEMPGEMSPVEPRPFIAMQPAPSRQQLSELAEVGQRVKQARRDARDAWFAVVLMGLFIVGGIVWSFDRFGKQEAKIEQLTRLLDAEKSAAFARVDKVQKLQLEIAGLKQTHPLGAKHVETVRLPMD